MKKNEIYLNEREQETFLKWDFFFFRYEFYGFILWNILNHVTLPLIMFYRFHSSVCLVDIWNYAYEPDMHTS